MRFRRNPRFEREFRATPEFKAHIATEAVIVATAIELAAVPFRYSGNYIDRISAHANRVELEKHFAHLMEYGSVNNPPQANGRRGVIAAGLRFADDADKPNPV